MTTFSIAAQATLEETRKILVATAKREHANVMRTNPRPVTFTRFVDGRRNAAEESVRGNGFILYQYPRLEMVAQYAMEVLRDLSPIGPPERGHYRDAHTMFLNGSTVSSLKGIKSGDEVTISNRVPYARKIEVGAMDMRVPGSDYVYFKAARIVRARYGDIAKIEFTFRGNFGGRFPAMTIRER